MNKTITKRVTKSYSAAEKQHHLATWRTSGLNMSDYCREAGISVSSLSIWNSHDVTQTIN